MCQFFLSDKQIIVYVQRFESSDYGKRLLGKLEWIFFQEAMLGDGRTYPKYFWGQNNTFWRWYSNVYCSISQQDKYTICLLCIVGKMIPQSCPVICNLLGNHWPGSLLHALTNRGSARWLVGCKRYAKFKSSIFYRHVFHNSWNGVELKSIASYECYSLRSRKANTNIKSFSEQPIHMLVLLALVTFDIIFYSTKCSAQKVHWKASMRCWSL